MSGTIIGANRPQEFPSLDIPLTDPTTGVMDINWFNFFLTLYNRSGASSGNNSFAYPYPTTTGTTGQKMVASGVVGTPGSWETVTVPTELSQLTNDTNFITIAALAPYATLVEVNQQISQGISTYNTSLQLELNNFATKANPTFTGVANIPVILATTINTTNFIVTGPTNFQTVTAQVGYQCKTGSNGSFGVNRFNISWDGVSAFLWIDGTQIAILTD